MQTVKRVADSGPDVPGGRAAAAMKLDGTLDLAPGLLQLGQTSRTSEDPGSPGLSWAVHYLLGTQGLHSLASPSPPASVPALPFSYYRTPVTLLLTRISVQRSRRVCAGLGIRTVTKAPESSCLHGADSLVGKADVTQAVASQMWNVCAFASCPMFQAVRHT